MEKGARRLPCGWDLTYADRLRDPRWKAKRAQVIQLRGNRCEHCGADQALQVHHKQYRRGRAPWDYPLHVFEVLCAPCHRDEHPRQTLRDRLRERLSATSESAENRTQRDALIAALRVLEAN